MSNAHWHILVEFMAYNKYSMLNLKN